MRYLFTYLFLISCYIGFSQTQVNICTGAEAGENAATLCDKIKCLYETGKFVEAYSALMVLGNDKCSESPNQLAIANTLAANNRFTEALTVLETLAKDSKYREEAQFEINRISRLKILADQKTGTYIQNLIAVNTQYNDLVAFQILDSMFCLYDKTDTISYFPRIETLKGRFHFPQGSMAELYFGESFFGWENYADISAGFAFEDSLIFLSVLPQSAFNGNNAFEIICIGKTRKKEIRKMNLSVKDFNIMHPATVNSTLYFSSDMEGGYGGMDLYKVDFNKDGYGIFTNLGAQINTADDEVFPAISGDSIFFASNRRDLGFGGLDLYKSSLITPYSINLGVPVNTAYDDFRPTAIEGKIKYFMSNRDGGKGGDDIYSVKFVEAQTFFQNLVGRINAQGQDLSAIIIQITSADGTFSKTTSLDKDGSFSLAHIKGLESYEISVVDGDLPEGSKLALFGDEGNVIKEVPMSATGQFKFELLTPMDYFLERVENNDESVLSVDILGMIDSEDLPDEGFKIYLEDSDGELIGMAVTDENGNFIFKSVKPDEKYVIRSKVTDPNAVINIVGKDGEVISSIKPTGTGEFAYVRLSDANRIITLTNESQQKVKVADNELFNLPVLYFEYNDAKLTTESEKSLSKLVVLLDKNPTISLELSGFTDSRGPAAYNLTLSQKRIDAVVQFLQSQGVGASRLVAKGYGETKLLNKCADGVECTEEEHAINRRTEIRIYQPSEP
ncbi:OmpA family protein [Cryomorpha ignava]|uniref:OmpA family protein n=1 Tax=Cryomorpha ignava TaxID=101383 RepID=A0A7K3WTS2_9FLAO|nr:OmpA family protein [Cryomorpha ignava]NEN25089.1 OmpA family protein [Cryomorpha ignava]